NQIRIKMRIIILLLLLFLNIQCKTKILNYQGIIVDKNNIPLNNLTIEGRDHSNIKVTTDNNGFFKLKAKNNFIETFLYIKREGKKIDSIQIIRTHPEYGVKFYFVDNRKDTLFIKK
ncbi:hypothetical protein V2595_15715, partial [Tenacibaculum maritimum]